MKSYKNFGKLPEDVQEKIDPELASKYANGNVVKAKKKKGKKSRFEREQEAQRKAIEDSNKNPEKGQSRSDSISEFDFIDEKTKGYMGGGKVKMDDGYMGGGKVKMDDGYMGGGEVKYKDGGSVCRGARLATAGKKFSGVY